ncbi:hypothetical protein RA263_10760 [Pseudomonas syringae pv. tagetis]|uniref:Cinnamyl-alcohol dehydrogenase-like protein n=3 Tax=Pseudomonas syringae group TaxID=136849 RepID=A0A0N8T2C2_9PSED|nr:hypothetical protein [Pseudomonas syringae group genomosp. 7]KPX45848.1 Cinnamyl-alcohol dehydrogenase-like protein [Pseudomonas syringae pv. helianthi]KPY82384.1 Cinnamyl-alcohol dehydrogenase-like protein [Pseudomonas syringae pv. tagetis]RMV44652.1 Cinnamyl-alcohol dehydrogenase-like protein [Pseudomonas syringae pv. helianthi]RMW17739.1 Cinnamyl-alcohol dehydrogenase-like protein [Pseudomonas syringae pv. tagetis]RMW20664.1 Cinnamyl-alcohol dehydrogenase-like protein [Pseudomonas syring
MISFVEIASIVRRLHRRPWLLPRYQIPDAIVRLIGPFFGLTQDYLSKHLGIRLPWTTSAVWTIWAFAIDQSRKR